jgi:hypothetical protein
MRENWLDDDVEIFVLGMELESYRVLLRTLRI